MKLPKSLVVWHEILSLFPDDIAQLITSVAKQLSPLIDSVSREELLGDIEPDGFAGLTSKASYERLLLAEWGLQDHFPDEFIRRAVSGEHLFLDVQRVEHRDNRQCYALFDCGPKQLGRPRLVQLVVLILLARRAAKAGVKLCWGVLQDSECTIYEEISKDSIKAWLEHRSASLSGENQLECWLSAINSGSDEQSVAIDDLWLVTPASIESAQLGYQQVKIVEPLLDLEKIDVAVESKRNKKTLTLKLNDEALNVRAIRDPFDESKKQVYLAREDHVGKWVVGNSGMRLACLNSVGKIALYNLNKHKVSKPDPQQILTLDEGRKLAGVFVSKKLCVLVSYDDDYLYLDNVQNKNKSQKVLKPEYMNFVDGELATVVVARENSTAYLFVLDASRNVSRINILDKESDLELYRAEVVALGQSVSCAWLVVNDVTSNASLEWYLGGAPVSELLGVESIGGERQVFSHGSGVWNKISTGPFAFQVSSDCWELTNGAVRLHNTTKVMVDLGVTVVGVISVKSGVFPGISIDSFSTKAVLVIVEEDRRTVRALWDDGEHEILVLESDFVVGEINPQNPVLHYLDSHNDLLAVNLLTGKTIFQLEQGLAR